MKTKLTLSIDCDFLPKAKQYAKAHGQSLSELIEETLKKLTMTQTDSFAQRWRGRFKPTRRRDARSRYLMKHYS